MANKKISSVMTEHNIQKLTDYEHVRKRLEMYLGSRSVHEHQVLLFSEDGYNVQNLSWVPSLVTAFREVIDNSLDAFKKSGTKDPVLKIDYNEETLSFKISDNAGGIPIDWVPEENKHLCTMVLTETKTGRNFDDSQREEVIGQNGLGGSVVMITSSEAEVEVVRSGRPYKTQSSNDGYDGLYKFVQKFQEGNQFFPELQIKEPTIRKVSGDKTGTTVSFTLSSDVFPNKTLPLDLVYSILKEIASANVTYKIFLNGKRISTKNSAEKTLFNVNKTMSLVVKDESFNFNSTFYIVPNAVQGMNTNFHMQGIVNNAPSFDGGTHLEAFKKHFALGVSNALEKESKKRKMKPNRSDIEEGLLIYNVTTMNAPSFNSQIKSKLTNENVVKPVVLALSTDFFDELVKKNKDWIDEIYVRCAERTNKKDADEDRRLAKKLLKAKVAKLRDAVNTNRLECELFITEGDSASGELIASRDPTKHAILPLRGKIKKVTKKNKISEIMESESLKDIMVSINLVPGEKAIRENLNYGRINISTDSDEDGKNIQGQICYFLYTFWPELFEDKNNPFVYIFNTPFIILKKGKEVKYFYGHQEHEYNPDDWKGWEVTRAKGLGSLNSEQFIDAIYNGYSLPIVDDGRLEETLDLIFNDDRADDRKEWMND